MFFFLMFLFRQKSMDFLILPVLKRRVINANTVILFICGAAEI